MVAVTPRARSTTKLLLLVAVVGLGGWLAARSLTTPQDLAARLSAIRDSAWAPVLFVVGYAVLATLDFSGLVLTLAGGIVFGFRWGVVLNTLGANVGASGAFWLARALGRDGIRAFLGNRMAVVDRLAEAQGFVWLLRLRLVPVVPFNLLNFAAGATAMSWRPFAAATALGILPGTVVYTWFADSVAAGVRDASRGALLRVAAAGAVLIFLTFVPWVVRRLRRSEAQ